MKKIIHLAEVKNDNSLITPESALRDALEDLREGKFKCNKMLIICLDDEDDNYCVRHFISNLRCSETLALLARAMRIANDWMDA